MNRERRDRLSARGHDIAYPDGLERARRERLQIAARKRNDDEAVRIDGTARGIHGARERHGLLDLTRRRVDDLQARKAARGSPRDGIVGCGARNHIELVRDHQRSGSRKARARRNLGIGQQALGPGRIGAYGRGVGRGGRPRATVGITVPLHIERRAVGGRIGLDVVCGLLGAIALDVAELDAVAVFDVVARSTDARIAVVDEERPIAPRSTVRGRQNTAVGQRRRRESIRTDDQIGASGLFHKVVEDIFGGLVVIAGKGNLGEGNDGLSDVGTVGLRCRDARHLGINGDRLALVGVGGARRALDRERGAYVLAGELGVGLIVWVALGIASILLAGQT